MTHDHVIGEGDVLADIALVDHERRTVPVQRPPRPTVVLVLHRHLA